MAQTEAMPKTYELNPKSRIREMPEWAGALVYAPPSPKLYYLNPTARAVLEISIGQTRDVIQEEFRSFASAVASADEADQVLEDTLHNLEENGILQMTSIESTDNEVRG